MCMSHEGKANRILELPTLCIWRLAPGPIINVFTSRPHKCYASVGYHIKTKMMCFGRKGKQNIRAAHFVYLALGARSAPSDVGFAKDYKFRANSPPGADT